MLPTRQPNHRLRKRLCHEGDKACRALTIATAVKRPRDRYKAVSQGHSKPPKCLPSPAGLVAGPWRMAYFCLQTLKSAPPPPFQKVLRLSTCGTLAMQTTLFVPLTGRSLDDSAAALPWTGLGATEVSSSGKISAVARHSRPPPSSSSTLTLPM